MPSTGERGGPVELRTPLAGRVGEWAPGGGVAGARTGPRPRLWRARRRPISAAREGSPASRTPAPRPRLGALCPCWVRGSPGTLPRSRQGDPPLDRRGQTGGPIPGGPGAWQPTHPAALTRPRRRPGARPRPLEKLAGSNPESTPPGRARTIVLPPEGGTARRPAAPPPRASPPRPPSAAPRRLAPFGPRGPSSGARGGAGAARGGARRRGCPPGRASGRRGQRRLQVAAAVGCAGVSSLWPAAGWWREEGTATGAGRGHPAPGP